MALVLLLLVAFATLGAPASALTIGYQGVAVQDLIQVQQAAAAALTVLQNEAGDANPIDSCTPEADYVSLVFNGTSDLLVDLSYTPVSSAEQPFVQLLLRAAQPNACNGSDFAGAVAFLQPSFFMLRA
jgi:hypothetical protein